MAESVDALVSNTSGFTSIPVRPRVWVLRRRKLKNSLRFFYVPRNSLVCRFYQLFIELLSSSYKCDIFFYFISVIPDPISQIVFNADIYNKKMNVICKFVIGYFLGIYFFLTLQRIVEKLLPFYILDFYRFDLTD